MNFLSCALLTALCVAFFLVIGFQRELSTVLFALAVVCTVMTAVGAMQYNLEAIRKVFP